MKIFAHSIIKSLKRCNGGLYRSRCDHLSEKLTMLKISSLKAEQKQAVVGLFNGKDVMAILSKGFGKSLMLDMFTLVKI